MDKFSFITVDPGLRPGNNKTGKLFLYPGNDRKIQVYTGQTDHLCINKWPYIPGHSIFYTSASACKQFFLQRFIKE